MIVTPLRSSAATGIPLTGAVATMEVPASDVAFASRVTVGPGALVGVGAHAERIRMKAER
jgi:hypothetical protein